MQKEWISQKSDGRKVIIDYDQEVIKIYNETFLVGFWGNKKKSEVSIAFNKVSLGSPMALRISSLPVKTEEGELTLSDYLDMDSLVEEMSKIAWDHTDEEAYRKSERKNITVWKRNKMLYQLCGYFCFSIALIFIGGGVLTYFVTKKFVVESLSSLILIFFGFGSFSNSKNIQEKIQQAAGGDCPR